MTKATPVTIVNVGYRSTNYWVVSAGRSRLLVDIGWPGTLGAMKANLKRMDIPLREIRYAVATHYHIDHAGLAEELKREGVPLLVLEVQVDAIPEMKKWTKPADHYINITAEGNVVIACAQSRDLLPPEAHAFDNPVALATWRMLRAHGATRVCPAHGPVRAIDGTPGKPAPT